MLDIDTNHALPAPVTRGEIGRRKGTMQKKGFIKAATMVAAGCALTGFVASVAVAQDAKATFEKNCVMCHGASGKGDGMMGKNLKPPPQDFATALKGQSDADIAKVIKEGGKAVGKSAAMPAYGSKLSDDQIKGIVDYIKGLK
jgi:mono/diheme cytochrome c family protein